MHKQLKEAHCRIILHLLLDQAFVGNRSGNKELSKTGKYLKDQFFVGTWVATHRYGRIDIGGHTGSQQTHYSSLIGEPTQKHTPQFTGLKAEKNCLDFE